MEVTIGAVFNILIIIVISLAVVHRYWTGGDLKNPPLHQKSRRLRSQKCSTHKRRQKKRYSRNVSARKRKR